MSHIGPSPNSLFGNDLRVSYVIARPTTGLGSSVEERGSRGFESVGQTTASTTTSKPRLSPYSRP